MCGRYEFSMEQSEELREIVRQVEERNTKAPWHPGEIYPTHSAPVLLWEGERPGPELLAWGFPGFQGSRSIINARAETAGSKPMFRKALDHRRCVVPSSGFYEWDKTKQQYRFTLPGSDALFMAGIWSEFAGERRFCILTTGANESVADIHSRMPVVLPGSRLGDWLESRTAAEAIMRTVPPLLSVQAVSAQIKLW